MHNYQKSTDNSYFFCIQKFKLKWCKQSKTYMGQRPYMYVYIFIFLIYPSSSPLPSAIALMPTIDSLNNFYRLRLIALMYSYFEKGCLTNEEKLTWQCRKLLQAMVVLRLHDWSSRCFSVQKETAQTRVFITSPSFLLNTVNLNQATPNSYYP